MPLEEDQRRIIAGIIDFQKRTAIQKCLVLGENCPEPVIQAHSVQSSYILDRLISEGHVYMFQRGVDGIRLAKVGRNQATTFTGFCQSHDSELFREVDLDGTRTFDSESKRQLALLSLRAVAREYWAKLNSLKMHRCLMRSVSERDGEALKRMLNLPSPYEEILIDSAEYFLKPFLMGTVDSTSRIQKRYGSLQTQIQNNKFHLMRSRIFSFDGEATLAVASVFAPEFDLEGKRLNTLREWTDPTDVVLTIFPCDDGTYALFTFHKKYANVLEPFFDQMEALEEHQLKQVLSKMVVMHCENTVLAPRMVDALTIEQQSSLEQLFNETLWEVLPYDQTTNVLLFEGDG